MPKALIALPLLAEFQQYTYSLLSGQRVSPHFHPTRKRNHMQPSVNVVLFDPIHLGARFCTIHALMKCLV